MLALDPGRRLPRGKLTAILWEDEGERAARHGLRQCLLDLRRCFAKAGVEAIRVEGDDVYLEPARIVVDVVRFERCIAQGTPEAIEHAAGLYRGDLLDGVSLGGEPFEEWLRPERERLRSQAVVALRKLLARYLREQDPDAAVQSAIRLLVFEPFDETVHRTLMRLYAEGGRRSAALRQYEDCVELLGRELGVEPEAETRQLYRQLVSDRARPTPLPRSSQGDRKAVSRPARARLVFRPPAGVSLVGRQADLGVLEDLRRRAQRGQPQLALPVGEAGIGKSRLVGELAARAQQRRLEVVLGGGREGEDILPFAPWIEALRPALNDHVLRRLAPVTRSDLARLFVELGEGPVPSSRADDGQRIFEAVAQLVRALSATRPLVVVVEDLHWCDDMTIRLLRFLPRRLGAAGPAHRHGAPGGGRRGHEPGRSPGGAPWRPVMRLKSPEPALP